MKILKRESRVYGSSRWIEKQARYLFKRDMFLLGFELDFYKPSISSVSMTLDFAKSRANWLDYLKAFSLISLIAYKQKPVFKVNKSYNLEFSQIKIDIRSHKIYDVISLFLMLTNSYDVILIAKRLGFSWSFGLRDLASVLNLSVLRYDFYNWPFSINVNVNFGLSNNDKFIVLFLERIGIKKVFI
jgi:hypothetical protein